MHARESTKKHDHDSRSALLESAKVLFSKTGLDGTSVREIASHAKVNPCLISYYFEGKEGLYRACLEEYGQARIEASTQILGPPVISAEDFKARLRLLITNILEVQLKEPELHIMLMKEERSVCASNSIKGVFVLLFTRSLFHIQARIQNHLTTVRIDRYS